MFSQLIGNVDVNSATALCVMFITLCVVLTTLIAKRRGKRELQMQFDIDKAKLKNEDLEKLRNNERLREYDMAKLSTERDVQFKRIETGLIEAKVNQPKPYYDDTPPR